MNMYVQQVRQAIILQNTYPRKNKLCILDEELGRIEGVMSKVPKQHLASGMLITYTLQMWRGITQLEDIEIIGEPHPAVLKHILFMHHVLELCIYFLSLNDPCSEIFLLVKELYDKKLPAEGEFWKKIFLCKFFKIIGIYPDKTEAYGAHFFRLISGDINSNFETTDYVIKNKLRTWLLDCVLTHPQAHLIKTMHFLHNL